MCLECAGTDYFLHLLHVCKTIISIFLGSKIAVDGDCSLEIKRCLLLGRKAMTNLDSILKGRDITLLIRSAYSKL